MKINREDIIKANRKGNREAELENQTGWKSIDKIFRSKKMYRRKGKHKKELVY